LLLGLLDCRLLALRLRHRHGECTLNAGELVAEERLLGRGS
jgi:hypothetical protein